MSEQAVRAIACALALTASAIGPSLAQTNATGNDPTTVGAAGIGFSTASTALTMAPDGSWGAATDASVGAAIAAAIAACRKMYQRDIGCGAHFTVMRAGWSLGIRCGNENIIVAAKTLVQAEQAAIDRETELRRDYVPDMPPCVRVVSIDPSGAIVAPDVAGFIRVVARPSRPSLRADQTVP
jgi:hypothetical protein